VNYNPYAPPQVAVQPYAQAPYGAGQPQPWEIGEVINAAFEAFKANWVVLVFSPFLAGLLITPAFVPMIVLLASGVVDPNTPEFFGTYAATLLVLFVPLSFFYVGIFKIALSAARGERPDFGLLFSGGSRFLAMMGTFYLMWLLLSFAFAMLFVPGVFLALALSMSAMFVVDQNMGPIEAMKASWAATEGHKMHLFLLGLVSFGMYLCGYIACGLGLFVVTPILLVTHAIVYLRISGRGGPAPLGLQPAYGGQYAAPGYGPPAAYGPPGGFGGPPQGGGPPGGQGGFGQGGSGGGFGQGGGGFGQGGQGGQGGSGPGGFGQGGFGGGGQGGGYGPPGGQGGPPPGGGGGFGGGGGYGPPPG
jgi:uncharacterized membrane protein